MRRGDVKSTQPQGTASVQSRKAQTVKEPTITIISEGDRDNATLCRSQAASGPDCRDHKSTQMTEFWKSEEEDSKSNHSLALQVAKEHPLMGMTRKGHAGVSETDQMIAMNTGGMVHSKTENTDRSSNGTGKMAETNQVRCKVI